MYATCRYQKYHMNHWWFYLIYEIIITIIDRWLESETNSEVRIEILLLCICRWTIVELRLSERLDKNIKLLNQQSL